MLCFGCFEEVTFRLQHGFYQFFRRFIDQKLNGFKDKTIMSCLTVLVLFSWTFFRLCSRSFTEFNKDVLVLVCMLEQFIRVCRLIWDWSGDWFRQDVLTFGREEVWSELWNLLQWDESLPRVWIGALWDSGERQTSKQINEQTGWSLPIPPPPVHQAG